MWEVRASLQYCRPAATARNPITISLTAVSVPSIERDAGAKGDDAGTIVVNDIGSGEHPSVVAYVNIPNELKKDSPPLDDVKRGDKLGVLGFVFSVKDKGTGLGRNPYADAPISPLAAISRINFIRNAEVRSLRG